MVREEVTPYKFSTDKCFEGLAFELLGNVSL